jgi:hypothetical protein
MRNTILACEGTALFLEILDRALLQYTRGSKIERLTPASRAANNEFIKSHAASVLVLGALVTDWVVRLFTSYRVGSASCLLIFLPYTACLRPVLLFLRVDVLQRAAHQMVRGWASI